MKYLQKKGGNVTNTPLLLILSLASFSSVIGAIILARERVKGWGWFLFCSVLLASAASSNN